MAYIKPTFFNFNFDSYITGHYCMVLETSFCSISKTLISLLNSLSSICLADQALNQLFEKIMALDIDERHLLRLGHGEEELETEKDFSR